MEFSYCIVTAVSKESQATEDKDSLNHQLRAARQYGDSMGGTFVTEYRVDGFTRSGYWNLSDAFADAPALGELAKGIQLRLFDVIILESFDRLGDLGFMLWSFLKPHRIQLRSVQQMLPIQDPLTYDPKRDDTTPTMINNSLNTNVYRIHKVERAFEVGTKNRVANGYFARRIPYGYIRRDKYNVELVPHVAELLRHFPVWFLEGKSIHKIMQLANESGVTSARGTKWVASPIINILQNPFYSGKVYYERGSGKSGVYRLHKVVEVHDGKHEPIWSYETHLKILDEFKRRAINPATKKDYNLSGLLKCGACGHSLWVAYDKAENKDRRRYWMCPNKHVYISFRKVEKLVLEALTKEFTRDDVVPNPDAPQTPDFAERELSALRRTLTRLEQAYESGAYTVDEFTAKRKAYKAREAELLDTERQKAEAKRRAVERVEAVLRMRDLIPVLPIWLTQSDPAEVRYQLARAVKITVNPDKTVKVELL